MGRRPHQNLDQRPPDDDPGAGPGDVEGPTAGDVYRRCGRELGDPSGSHDPRSTSVRGADPGVTGAGL
jgi:hypothetical protein